MKNNNECDKKNLPHKIQCKRTQLQNGGEKYIPNSFQTLIQKSSDNRESTV
jgi:hypothetical protein